MFRFLQSCLTVRETDVHDLFPHFREKTVPQLPPPWKIPSQPQSLKLKVFHSAEQNGAMGKISKEKDDSLI